MTAWFVLFWMTVMGLQPAPQQTVGLVVDVSGSARVSIAGAPPVPLSALTWLADGSRVAALPNSSVTVVLWSGHRWQIGGEASALVTRDSVRPISGSVKPLPPVPELPVTTPIVESQRAGGLAAVRVRGDEWLELYPHAGVRSRASSTTLHFRTRAAAAEYHVELSDERGIVLLGETTARTELLVPSALLQSGTRYVWTVRAKLGNTWRTARASFQTIAPDLEQSLSRVDAACRDDESLRLMCSELARRALLFEEAVEWLDRSPDGPVAARLREEVLLEISPVEEN